MRLTSQDPPYKTLIYSGQLDVIIGAALTERFLPLVPWAGQAAIRDETRRGEMRRGEARRGETRRDETKRNETKCNDSHLD